MPKIKEKTKTIIIQAQEGITPNRTNLSGATRIKGTRTSKGEIITNSKGIIKTIFGKTSLVPFVVSMAIILTIPLKSFTLNG
jgi:hypothetical protein